MSKIQTAISAALDYDQSSGVFTRRVSSGGQVVGAIAGAKRKDGYLHVSVGGRNYLAHRLAWAYVTGEWPTSQIDHIDGNRLNNAFANLRDVSPKTNQQNHRRAHKNSTTGLLGASWDKSRGKFIARIKIGNQNKSLGRFATAEEAHEAYVRAKRQHHNGGTL